MVEKNGAAGLQQILVDERQDADVVLGSDRRRHDGMVVVDDLLERADGHGRAAQIVDLRALLLLALFLRSQALLILDELLLHEQVVLDAFLPQQLESAPRVRQHLRQLVGRFGALRLPLLLAYASWHGRFIFLLLVLSSIRTDVLLHSTLLSPRSSQSTLSSFLSPRSRPAPGCLFPMFGFLDSLQSKRASNCYSPDTAFRPRMEGNKKLRKHDTTILKHSITSS